MARFVQATARPRQGGVSKATVLAFAPIAYRRGAPTVSGGAANERRLLELLLRGGVLRLLRA